MKLVSRNCTDSATITSLPVGETGCPHAGYVRITDMTAALHQGLSEMGSGVALGVARPALTVQRDLIRRNLGEMRGDIAVRSQTIIAAVHLGDSKRDGVPGLDVERFAECALQAHETC